MSKGIFQIISESYQIGAKNMFEYSKGSPLLFRPLLYSYALLGYLMLFGCSFIFYILIVFDHLSNFVNSIRTTLLNSIESNSDKVLYSFWAFVFSPIIIGLLTPIFILSAIIPKISSEIDIDEFTGEVLSRLNISGKGTFRKIIRISFETISNLYTYIGSKKIITWPFLVVPALMNSGILLFIIIISTPLLLFDILSYIVDSIRAFIIKISRRLGQSTKMGFGSFVFSPIIMLFLVPVFIVVLIVPKFTTGIDGIE